MLFFWGVLRASFAQFFKEHYYIRCSALTYTTLLGCIPFFSVFVSLLSKLPVIKEQVPNLQHFVFINFLPHQGEKLTYYIETFSRQAQKLPWSQFVFLIIVSLILVLSIERTLNHILGERQLHSILHGFLRSCLVIFLMTIFMVISLTLSHYILSIPLLSHLKVVSFLDEYSSGWLPFLSSFAGFSMVYCVIPNQKISFRQAMLGGLTTCVLFEAMKLVFAWFVVSVPTYNALYGTLAIIPIFMIWIYGFWCVFIYGALVIHQLRLD